MTIYIGDSLTWLKKLPSESVNCIVTSPPYYGLRDYGIAGQMGLEETPEMFIDGMVTLFREARRVLRNDGTLWLNIGDSYWANRTENGEMNGIGGTSLPGRENHARAGGKSHSVYKPKDMMFIPHRVAMALQADGWYIRNTIIWHKPNPMPESVTDRCTKSHEYIFLCAKSERYYFDADAIREPHIWADKDKRADGKKHLSNGKSKSGNYAMDGVAYHPNGRNKRDVWTINTRGSDVAHFATMPMELAENCIKAGCPETVCAECGMPYVRETEKHVHIDGGKRNSEGHKGLDPSNNRGNYPRATITVNTLGFQPTCTCNGATRHGVVLDPFGGAGTTALAAIHLNRQYQLIELNIKYVGIAQQRIAAFNPMQDTVLPDGSKQLSLFRESA